MEVFSVDPTKWTPIAAAYSQIVLVSALNVPPALANICHAVHYVSVLLYYSSIHLFAYFFVDFGCSNSSTIEGIGPTYYWMNHFQMDEYDQPIQIHQWNCYRTDIADVALDISTKPVNFNNLSKNWWFWLLLWVLLTLDSLFPTLESSACFATRFFSRCSTFPLECRVICLCVAFGTGRSEKNAFFTHLWMIF